MKDASAIIILLDTSEDRNSMKMKDVSAIIMLLDTSEDRNSMKMKDGSIPHLIRLAILWNPKLAIANSQSQLG